MIPNQEKFRQLWRALHVIMSRIPRNQRLPAGAVLATMLFLVIWARPVASLAVMFVWSAVVLRLVGKRATLSGRTFTTYLILGALLELVTAPFIVKVLGPYASRDELATGILAGVIQAAGFGLLLLPVVRCLFITRVHVMTSVADAFLLTFVTVVGAQMPLLIGSSALRSVSFWWHPTPEFALFPGVWPGWAYWGAILFLIFAAGMRFVRQRWVALAMAAVTFIYFINQMTVWIPSLWLVYFDTGTNIWVALIALALLSVLEWKWMRRAAASSPHRSFAEKLSGFCQVFSPSAQKDAHGIPRQYEIVKAELCRSPNDAHIAQIARSLERLIRVGKEVQASAYRASRDRDTGIVRRLSSNGTMLAWILIGLIFIGLPRLPLAWTQVFWSLLTFPPPIPRIPTFLNLVLMLVVALRYLPAMGNTAAPEGDANTKLRFYARRMILQLSMGAVFLVLSNIDLVNFVAQDPYAPSWRGLGLGQPELATLLLLFAVGASGFAADPAGATAGREGRREVIIIRNSSTLAQGLVVVWLGMFIGESILPAIQRSLGGGNYVIAVAAALATGALAFVLALLLRFPCTRLEDSILSRLTRLPEGA